jgi:hypothetical protein
MKLSGIAEQKYTGVYGKAYIILKVKQWFLASAGQEVNDHEN